LIMKNISKLSIVSAMLLNAVFCINGYSMNKLDNTIEQNKQIEEISVTMDINELIKRITHIIINNENKTNETIDENTAKELFPSLDHYKYDIYDANNKSEYIDAGFNTNLDKNCITQNFNDLLRDNIKFASKYDINKNKEIKLLFINRWEELCDLIFYNGGNVLYEFEPILTNVLPSLGINDFEPLRENNIKNNNDPQNNNINYDKNYTGQNNGTINQNQSMMQMMKTIDQNIIKLNNMITPNNLINTNNTMELMNMVDTTIKNMMIIKSRFKNMMGQHYQSYDNQYQNNMNYYNQNQNFNNMQSLNNMYNMNQSYNNQYQNSNMNYNNNNYQYSNNMQNLNNMYNMNQNYNNQYQNSNMNQYCNNNLNNI